VRYGLLLSIVCLASADRGQSGPIAADTPSLMRAAGPEFAHRPIIGAEIWDDPTATQEKVDHWFKILADYQMPLARVFVPRGEQSLQRMDWFFRAAEKYKVGITATLGGTPSEENGQWIQEVVKRYKDSPALDSWILMNEPGAAPRMTDTALSRFRIWLREKYRTADVLNQAWGGRGQYTGFDQVEYREGGSAGAAFADWYAFNRDLLTSNLAWIAGEIRKVDMVHPTHVNPHALISNLAGNSQDLPAWRPFLTSLGASCHPSWHFGLLRRDQYALGVAYISDLIRGSSEPKPFWITELQGGPNTNSGTRPLSPLREDIAQWLWTGLGSGADRIVFWLLNNRSFSSESGEWSLLNLQDKPSERLETAGQVARAINQNTDFFRDARPVDAPITVILSLDAMTLQENIARNAPVTSTEGGQTVRPVARDRQAHLLAALAYYEAFLELGIPVHIKHIHDFDWKASSASPQLVVLPNVVALSAEQARDIETFVRNGNTALITGLTGAWDLNYRFTTLASRFPLEGLLGATLADIHTLDPNQECQVSLQKPVLTLPSSLWVGEIENRSAEVIGKQKGWVTAVRSKAGKGEAIWIPSLVDVGAWVGENKPLARLLAEVTAPFMRDLPFRFVDQQPDCLLRVLRNGRSFVTVVTNGTMETRRFSIRRPQGLSPKTLWGEGSSVTQDGHVSLGPRGTVVAMWR
jgi:beta-galactosidase